MSYQGWTNYGTWCIHLWISNEEPVYRYWNELAQKILDEHEYPKAHLRDALKDQFEDAMPPLEGMWSDLMTNTLEEVNWHEIAEALLEDKQPRNMNEDRNPSRLLD